jgi:hypothetical protein
VDDHLQHVIGTQIEVTYTDGKPPVTVDITHYAIGRIARWARINGMTGLSPDSATSMADSVLCVQLACWAEVSRGQAKPVDFDEWVATVADFNAVEVTPADPTQPAT